jgi:hypothetical protein
VNGSRDLEPVVHGRPDNVRFRHLLGEFRFARTLRFAVYGDDERDPRAVKVVLDDGVQEPYRILTVEGLGRLSPAPVTDWLRGWIDECDPWARVIYGNTIGIVRQARAVGSAAARPGLHEEQGGT